MKGFLELHHGGFAFHLFLYDADGTLDEVNGLNQVLLRGLKSGLLLGPLHNRQASGPPRQQCLPHRYSNQD